MAAAVYWHFNTLTQLKILHHSNRVEHLRRTSAAMHVLVRHMICVFGCAVPRWTKGRHREDDIVARASCFQQPRHRHVCNTVGACACRLSWANPPGCKHIMLTGQSNSSLASPTSSCWRGQASQSVHVWAPALIGLGWTQCVIVEVAEPPVALATGKHLLPINSHSARGYYELDRQHHSMGIRTRAGTVHVVLCAGRTVPRCSVPMSGLHLCQRRTLQNSVCGYCWLA